MANRESKSSGPSKRRKCWSVLPPKMEVRLGGFYTFYMSSLNSNMMKQMNSITLLLLFLFVASCSVTKQYNQARTSHSIGAMENFLSKYPNSKFTKIAQEELHSLYEEQDWDKAKRINTVFSYENFITFYSNSRHVYDARISIFDLKEEQAWRKADKESTLASYKQFVSDFPNGRFANSAEKKMIDIEVDEILAGEHGTLAPMSKTSSGNNHSTTSEIETFNNTKFTLTVYYSGIESKKLILKSFEKKALALPNGSYRVAASVNDKSINNYAGSDKLDGGKYTSEFYIKK